MAVEIAGKKQASGTARRKPRPLGHPAEANTPRNLHAAPLGLAIGVALLGAALRGEPADDALEPAERYGDFA